MHYLLHDLFYVIDILEDMKMFELEIEDILCTNDIESNGILIQESVVI